MAVEKPIVLGTLVERFANETVVDESIAENTINNKMEVDFLLVKLLGVEDQQQASYSDGSLVFHFSNTISVL